MSTCWRWVSRAATSSSADGLVAGQDERPRLALDDRVRVGAVVLAERVAGGLDDDAERVKPASVGVDVEGHAGDARVERDALGGDLLAVGEQPDRGRLGDRRADLGDGLDRLAEVGRGRRRQPLDERPRRSRRGRSAASRCGCRAWRRARPRPGRRRSCRCRRTAARSASGRRRGRARWRAGGRRRCRSPR